MARGATARLYDVDEDSVVFKKFNKSKKYDHGSITFRARKGRLIDLDQMHESVWATRLSGGTRSGLVSLVVTAIGDIGEKDGHTVLRVVGSDAYFVLEKNPEEKYGEIFDALNSSSPNINQVVKVTGRLDGWKGRWPTMLSAVPEKPRCILVTDFELMENEE